MFKRILLGGVAGAVATIPQSGVVWGFRRAGLYSRTAAPEVVSERLTKRLVDVDVRHLPDTQRRAVKTIEHVGFGAGAGLLFGALTAPLSGSAAARPLIPMLGLAMGLAVWVVSYRGWLPALGLMPPPERDEQGRAGTMIAAHVAYGLTLGALMSRWAKAE